jgi:sulfoxide reductase heme-binding subunit YedZ
MLALTGQLGAKPIEKFTRGLGDRALRLLLITLCVTPLRKLTGWNSLIKLRRMLGLFAFFYACLHVLSHLALLLGYRLWVNYLSKLKIDLRATNTG